MAKNDGFASISIESARLAAPCQAACPILTRIPTYVSLIKRKRFKEAFEVIAMDNPLPSACARVCHHPCQTRCQALNWGGPVSIRVLKRVATDFALNTGQNAAGEPAARPSREAIAVVGAGPAGLSAANDLALEGYRVTIFERLERAGGAMAACIPEYRLPNDVLDVDVGNILRKGVELRLGVEVGRDVTFAQLRDSYKAVFLATGCHKSNRLGVEGEEAEGVLHSMRFLNDRNLCRNRIPLAGKVGVVGGGNAAMDAARVSIRQNGTESVTLIYRRSREEMPAFAEEIEAALDEGVNMITLANPSRIIAQSGRMTGVECLRMGLGEPDAGGRRRPVPIQGSEFIVELDSLIVAIGESSDLSYLGNGHGMQIGRTGAIVADPNDCSTAVTGVFAGGDGVTGPKTVIEAISAGKRAAYSIDCWIRTGKPAHRRILPQTTMYSRPNVKLAWR